MSIDLLPEHQELIDAAIRSGAYSDARQVIGRALEALMSEDEWLRAHRDTIDEKIGRGLAQLDRGEGIPGGTARAALQKRKSVAVDRLKSPQKMIFSGAVRTGKNVRR